MGRPFFGTCCTEHLSGYDFKMLNSVYAALLAGPLITLFSHTAAQAQEDVPESVLKPTSDWQLNYADDSCRLLRIFGDGDSKTILYIERYEPSDSFMMVVAGSPLKSRGRSKVEFRFGPYSDNPWRSYEVKVGDFGSFEPALIFSSTTLIGLEGIEENSRFVDDFDPEHYAQLQLRTDVSPEVESAIRWLDVHHGRAKPVRFALGSLAEPMKAMRDCMDELLTHWGIDIEAHSHLTRPVVPASNPGRWLTPKDYPVALLRKGMQGIVKFRLSVDATGKPTQCHIQKSTRPEGFDKAVCEGLMRKAEFEPALGKDGKPIASYWHSSVLFQI